MDGIRQESSIALEVDAMYEKVRNKRVEFEEVLTEYFLIDKKIQEKDEQIVETDKFYNIVIRKYFGNDTHWINELDSERIENCFIY
jgi:hypothetical protein